jgi:hypothetical protein
MRDGRIVAELSPDEATENLILSHAMGEAESVAAEVK